MNPANEPYYGGYNTIDATISFPPIPSVVKKFWFTFSLSFNQVNI